MTDWSKIKYFSPEEFLYPDRLRPGMVEVLDEIRERAGIPLRVTSSYRDAEKNASVKGAKASAHMPAADGFYSGVDIAAPSSVEKFKIVNCAFLIGLRRIGVYPKHVHLDIEPHLAQLVLWVGKD